MHQSHPSRQLPEHEDVASPGAAAVDVRVLRGNPDECEVAALVAVLALAGRRAAGFGGRSAGQTRPRPRWTRRSRVSHAPHSWVHSTYRTAAF